MANAKSKVPDILRRFIARLRQPEWLFVATVTLTVFVGAIGAVLSRSPPTPGPVVRFVLPSAFQGLIIIECDCPDGAPEQWNGNVVTYTIPNSGRLRVASCSAFREWHKLRAETDMGHALPTETDDSVADSDNKVRLWELGAMAQNLDFGIHSSARFLVGTRSDFEEVRAARSAFMGNRTPEPVGGK